MLRSIRRAHPREEVSVPFAAIPVRQRNPSRPAAARPRGVWIVALVVATLALGACLQDAHNADKNFVFDNANDPTSTSSSGIAIVAVDYLSKVQTVVIVNSSGNDQDMNKWSLLNQTTTNIYGFTAFTLAHGTFVRVHPGTGTNTATDIYTEAPGPTSLSWKFNDVAILQNDGGGNVSSCTVGSPTC